MSCGGKTTIESLSISPTNINVANNTVIQFEAAGSKSNGVISNVNTQVTWSSSNPACASVNGSGLVTANPNTTCSTTITASSPGNITAPATLTVTVPVPATYTVGTNPSAIAIDSAGNIWVTNWGSNNVSELSSAGVLINTYTVGSNPSGIAIDSAGNVWVTNQGSNNVTELNSTGAFVNNFAVGSNPSSIVIDPSSFIWVTNMGTSAAPGTSVTELTPSGAPAATYFDVGSGPTGITIGPVGLSWTTWVANMGYPSAPGNTITGLNSVGSSIGTFTLPAGSELPDSIAVDPSDNLWVTNQGSNTIIELNVGGGVIPFTSSPALSGPSAVRIDTAGSVWVANYGSTAVPGNTIVELNPFTGQIINTFTVQNNPSAIAIDSLNNVWVANYGSNSVTVWRGAATGPQFRTYTVGPIWP